MNNKKKILIVIGRYLPGYKSGGPVRTTKNLIDNLGDEYDFRVLCQDRDLGDTEQYPNIKLYDWNKVGNAMVYYIPEKKFTSKLLIKLSKEVDLIYMWGCFNIYTVKILFLKKFNKIKVPVVVAAMGLFSPKAFRIKYLKKKTTVTIMNFLGLFKNVYWSATSKLEINEIRQQVKSKETNFYIAEDLPRHVDNFSNHSIKEKNKLSVCWISRIDPKKNLIYAIDILSKVSCNVDFTIYGPIFDQKYWNECFEKLNKLPSNIKCEYKGNIESENVVETLRSHNVFLFPTLGENYGHVIQEALSAGCLCILSDQTPWRNLETEKIGYVFSLDNKELFVNAINRYSKLSDKEFKKLSNLAVKYAIENSNQKVKNTGYRKIFDELVCDCE